MIEFMRWCNIAANKLLNISRFAAMVCLCFVCCFCRCCCVCLCCCVAAASARHFHARWENKNLNILRDSMIFGEAYASPLSHQTVAMITFLLAHSCTQPNAAAHAPLARGLFSLWPYIRLVYLRLIWFAGLFSVSHMHGPHAKHIKNG